MSGITTHILDTARGRPAAGVSVLLEQKTTVVWQEISRLKTDNDGRAKGLLPDNHNLQAGLYRLSFETGEYFKSEGVSSFYPCVSVQFEIHDTSQHYHVPLLISPFGYSTYRGS